GVRGGSWGHCSGGFPAAPAPCLASEQGYSWVGIHPDESGVSLEATASGCEGGGRLPFAGWALSPTLSRKRERGQTKTPPTRGGVCLSFIEAGGACFNLIGACLTWPGPRSR